MALSEQDQVRLAKLLAMFSSDHDGEVLNAARAAERLIKRAGETWEAVITRHTPRSVSYEYQSRPYTAKPQKRAADPDHWAEVKACEEQAVFLTAWEREFLTSLCGRWELSDKQRNRLDQIKSKLEKFKDVSW